MMRETRTAEAKCISYELKIEIKASCERVWQALIEEINAWWLPDFHMVGEGSVVSLDARAGGGLVEYREGSGSLLWYTVQWCRPEQYEIYLVGHLTSDWGGPATSSLKLELQESRPGRCVLRVADAHFGHVDTANIKSLQEGWTRLFTDGLKKFVEEGERRDALT
jgi:uncharacterized protein YndB with AHSA1/START domain